MPFFRKIQQVSGNRERNEDLEMLSPTVRRRAAEDDDENEDESQVKSGSPENTSSQGKTNFVSKAKEDHQTLKTLLKPKEDGVKGLSFPVEEQKRFEFLQNPTTWLSNYDSHEKTFTDDEDYLDYVLGLLEVIVESSPYGEDKDDICTPLLLLEKLITVKSLKKRRDPMRTALKLQSLLQEYAQIENDKNSIYDRKIEEIENIPKQFTLDLMNLCITPSEVAELMRLDDSTMFEDVLKSKNKTLIASKFYQKIVWKTFWGTDATVNKNAKDSKLIRTLYTVKRLASFIFWNIFYLPIAIFKRCDKPGEKRKKQKEQFFSPFSSYLADLINYTILLLLLLHVTLTTVPDPSPTYRLIAQLNAGNITFTDDDPNFRIVNNITEVLLPTPIVPPSEWALWACILARVLTEFYQAYQKKGETTGQKIKNYLGSVSNLCDIVLVLLLVTAMCFKLEMYLHSIVSGIYNSVHTDEFGHNSHPVQLVYTIYFYSSGAVFALVHFLHTATIHIPGIGPLLRAIQKMFVDIGHVVLLFVFFVAGFLIPLHGMVSTYRAAHAIDGIDDKDDFYSLKSVSNSLLTLIWGVFGGLSYSEKETLYSSQDTQTTLFMTILLVTYAIILSLMCMNLLIAMMCNTYSIVTADKSADWRFAQFESIMEYNATTNTGNGMPFLFPLCIPYILYCLVTEPCRKKRMRKRSVTEIKKDNPFAKFLCKFRLDPAKAKARALANNPVNNDMIKQKMAMALNARVAKHR